MKNKIYNFFNHPWIAFPLAIIIFIIWMHVMLKIAHASDDRYSVDSNGTVKVPDLPKNS